MSTEEYDARWQQLAAQGHNIHGEADFVGRYAPASVLDGGCGTGRVAIELARRGIDVVGVDVDTTMLAAARAKAPHITWVDADLAALDLGRTFELIALPGNVMIFVEPVDRGRTVLRMAAHLAVGGLLVAGFQLGSGLSLAEYDALAGGAGFELVERFATWDGAPFAGGDYAVSVHRLAERATRTTVHSLLAEARADAPARLHPGDLVAALDDPGTLVVDVRMPDNVRATGTIAGSWHAPLSVLLWRADPASGSYDPVIGGFDRRLVVVCNQGYSSGLAAAALRRIGYARATDVVGGIEAWQRAGLPLVPPPATWFEIEPR
jgi:rhodanese-related sulfurtransferase